MKFSGWFFLRRLARGLVFSAVLASGAVFIFSGIAISIWAGDGAAELVCDPKPAYRQRPTTCDTGVHLVVVAGCAAAMLGVVASVVVAVGDATKDVR